jgi:DNA-binding CsgD family transcriptional regulator/PAS domain-containing protein
VASDNDWRVQREVALELILEATLRQEAWNDFIGHVCKVVGANSGAIAIRSSEPALELIDPVAATWPGEVVEAYITDPREADPMVVDLAVSMFALRNGKSFITQELVDDHAYRQTPFFHEFASKFDIAYLAGVSMDIGAHHFGTLMVYREDASPTFSQDARRFLESLARPLQIGLDTRRRLKGNMVAHGVLSRLTTAVVTLDERGRVDYANHAAEELFRHGDAVSITAGRIRTRKPDTTAALRAMCLDAVRGDVPRQGRELFLPRVSGAPPLRALILPLSHRLLDSLWGGEVPAAIFFFDVQEEDTAPDASIQLRRAHGCTETEALVAVLYADGATSTQIAETLEVSRETIKTHLKRVFLKTQVRSKAELVKLTQRLRSPLRR